MWSAKVEVFDAYSHTVRMVSSRLWLESKWEVREEDPIWTTWSGQWLGIVVKFPTGSRCWTHEKAVKGISVGNSFSDFWPGTLNSKPVLIKPEQVLESQICQTRRACNSHCFWCISKCLPSPALYLVLWGVGISAVPSLLSQCSYGSRPSTALQQWE